MRISHKKMKARSVSLISGKEKNRQAKMSLLTFYKCGIWHPVVPSVSEDEGKWGFLLMKPRGRPLLSHSCSYQDHLQFQQITNLTITRSALWPGGLLLLTPATVLQMKWMNQSYTINMDKASHDCWVPTDWRIVHKNIHIIVQLPLSVR